MITAIIFQHSRLRWAVASYSSDIRTSADDIRTNDVMAELVGIDLVQATHQPILYASCEGKS